MPIAKTVVYSKLTFCLGGPAANCSELFYTDESHTADTIVISKN